MDSRACVSGPEEKKTTRAILAYLDIGNELFNVLIEIARMMFGLNEDEYPVASWIGANRRAQRNLQERYMLSI